ncbi:FAD dependent oxidoreductase [Singulisphaera sp. GP187]|uniref:FAD-dependent oxidoreductase n=1 Tax=Singulisphaera sp. GP187 TaxID=1882752 RepID=UPI00092A45F8|nr:FAD-dependent oxidoreductase [Singulisphaera sp. GP187]SIO25775.1 FAD dependent oxidoreductase [Singulisphaera sp. GP187]
MRRREFLGTCATVAGLGLGLGPAAKGFLDEQVDKNNNNHDFDVVIAGGSTAAFAAAVAAAEAGARTCLIEPTDWVGGQLTSSGVPAIDEAWHKITDKATGAVLLDVATIARSRENMTPNFRAMLDATGNPGRGWVSNYCFEPKSFLEHHLHPLEAALRKKGTLTVYRDAVVKRVETDAEKGLVTAVEVVQRTPKPGVASGGYDRHLSEDLADWYSPEPSARFDKRVIRFASDQDKGKDRSVVFVDATEWGELLVLSGAPYLQGVEATDGGREGDDRCGQSTVFDLVERLNPAPVDEPPGPADVDGFGFDDQTGRPDAWAQVWTYRRIKSAKGGGPPAVGDLCLQNWGYSARRKQGGNDYPFGYLFRSRAETDAERADWRGGVDLAVIAAAERRALGWHAWFKNHPPEGIAPGQVSLEREALGTGHGLAKVPYVRDTRRSVGLDGFLLKGSDLSGPPQRKTGRRFYDHIALGAYASDVHPIASCAMPAYVVGAHETLPFLIPFRALTNERFSNLLVAGKTMAQSFLANAATRLHPIEWSSGTAAGVAAADMAFNGRTSRQELDRIEALQELVSRKTPIVWTIDGQTYPGTGAGVER